MFSGEDFNEEEIAILIESIPENQLEKFGLVEAEVIDEETFLKIPSKLN